MGKYFIKFKITYRPKSFETESPYSECECECETVIDLTDEEITSVYGIKDAIDKKADIFYKTEAEKLGIIYQRVSKIVTMDKL